MDKFQEYLQSAPVKALSKNTSALYAHSLNHAQKFVKHNKIPEDEGIKWLSENIGKFSEYLERQQLSGKSIQQYLTGTKIFLKWAGHKVEFTYKISNKDRQANKLKHLGRWFDEHDIALCLDYQFPKSDPLNSLAYRILVRLLLETGGRIGELATLKLEDIDMEECSLVLHGKSEARPVFFGPKTLELLVQFKKTLKMKKDQLIYPSVERCKQLIVEMLVDLGLKKPGGDGRGPHTFRHYCASYLFFIGEMRIDDISFLLGDNVETIRAHYLHPTSWMLRMKVAKAYHWEGD